MKYYRLVNLCEGDRSLGYSEGQIIESDHEDDLGVWCSYYGHYFPFEQIEEVPDYEAWEDDL